MKKASRRASVKIVLLIGLAVGIAAVYFWGKNYFSSHFYPGTVVNGIDCGGMTAEAVKEEIQKELQRYTLVLRERGGAEETITGEQLAVRYADDGGVDALLSAQKDSLWFLAVGRSHSYQVAEAFTYEEAGISELLGRLKCFQQENITPPSDAFVEDTGTAFAVSPEVQGNLLDRDRTAAAVKEAVETGKTEIDLDALGLYEQPSVLSTDPKLQEEADFLNRMTAASITYDFGDRQMTVNREAIKNWIVKGEDGEYVLDRGQMLQWVTQMAYETDTFGLEHTFTTTSGAVITLAAGGDYGWVIDREATTEALLQMVQEGQTATVEPVYLYEGADRSVNDIGDTYVEICIVEQRMWCYQDGQLIVDTPVVTGCHSTGYDTPSGSVWAIDAKEEGAHFDTYNSDVDFWLPFNGDCGIHDASWRGEDASGYGGDIWQTNGSHGCVNTPRSAAQTIFNAMEIGYPVVVYYSVDQVVGPEPTQDVEMG